MISRMRPRRPCVSDGGADHGDRFRPQHFCEVGHRRVYRKPSPRAMMPRRISVVPPWMVSLGATVVAKASCSSRRRAVADLRREEGGEFAHAVRQLLLPDGAEVLHDRAFHHRLLAGLQHAGDRDRHAPQRVQLRDQPAEPFGAAQIGLGAERADQLDQHIEGFEETLRPAALVGEFAGRLLPGAVDLAQHMIVRHEGVVEHDLVEVVLAGHLDRSD